MKLLRVFGLIALTGMASVALAADAPAVDPLIKGLTGEVAGPQRTPEELQAAYTTAFDTLMPQMAPDKGDAQLTWQTICFRASRPGAEPERLAVCKVMAAKLAVAAPVHVRVWLLKQLELIGRGEAVDALAPLLDDKDALVREHARKALQRNPDAQAAAKLRAALDKATDPSWTAGLINALGYRKDTESVAALAKRLGSADAMVAGAAAAALGEIGGEDAARALTGALKASPANPTLRRIVTNAYLLAADKLAAAGKKDEAVALYEPLFAPNQPRRLRMAALHGIAQARGEAAIPVILKTLTDKDGQVQATASRLLVQMPGTGVTQAAADQLKNAAPDVQGMVLRALADRGDVVARPAVLDAAKSNDETVRAAALSALGVLGDASTVPLLASAAATGAGPVQRAARESLNRVKGDEVDSAILSELKSNDARVRAELVRSLSARRAATAIPALFTLTAKDGEETVRAEAVNALSTLSGSAQLSQFLLLFVNARGENERGAAEKAVTVLFDRIADSEERAAPVLLALKGATGETRLALLSLLGRTGSATALDVIRAALKEKDDEVKDVAVKALADWPDAAAADDLLAIAKDQAQSRVHRVLAFRGYIRVVGLPSARPGAETVRLFEAAMALAPSADSKKQVLAGLSDVAAVEALQMVDPLLNDAEVGTEAQFAVVKIARSISGGYRDEALAALKKVRGLTKDETLIKQIDEGVDVITRFEDFITDWMMVGPFTAEGKDGGALFDTAFEPEKANAPGLKWLRAPAPADKNKPWDINLNATEMRGDNRVTYLRTSVFSPKKQECSLEVGSDDGIKVWLNGQQVHANNAARPDKPGEDKVKVTLNEGWNSLLLKVCNGAGDWGASARFRTATGEHVEGLRVKAE